MLSTVAMIAALGSMWALTLLAITGIDDVPAWNPKAITFPVPDPVAAIAGVFAATALVRIAMTLYRRQRVHRRVRDALMHIESGDPDVVVIADRQPDAFVVPGPHRSAWRGPRIVVTDGMRSALDDEQWRALLAHERAHLDAGHHRLRAATDLAAAANPLLIPARRTVGYLCERWADERAGREVGSRRLVAGAIATAALAHDTAERTESAHGGTPGIDVGALRHGAIGFNGVGTVDRVVALQRPAPTALRTVIAMAVLVTAGVLLADANATGELFAVLRVIL
jgi:hypothetical protein